MAGKFKDHDRVTDGFQNGFITGFPMDGWVRVYWNSTGDLHHETVREEDIKLYHMHNLGDTCYECGIGDLDSSG